MDASNHDLPHCDQCRAPMSGPWVWWPHGSFRALKHGLSRPAPPFRNPHPRRRGQPREGPVRSRRDRPPPERRRTAVQHAGQRMPPGAAGGSFQAGHEMKRALPVSWPPPSCHRANEKERSPRDRRSIDNHGTIIPCGQLPAAARRRHPRRRCWPRATLSPGNAHRHSTIARSAVGALASSGLLKTRPVFVAPLARSNARVMRPSDCADISPASGWRLRCRQICSHPLPL
jgi:hypothetical protein